jgi:hypothetical protein
MTKEFLPSEIKKGNVFFGTSVFFLGGEETSGYVVINDDKP